MPLVMLKRNWPSSFRRTLKPDGNPARVITLAPGDFEEVALNELASIAGDIGAALVACKLDDKGRPKPVDLTYEELVGQAVEDAIAASEPESIAEPPDLLTPPELVPSPTSPDSNDAENAGGRSRRRR